MGRRIVGKFGLWEITKKNILLTLYKFSYTRDPVFRGHGGQLHAKSHVHHVHTILPFCPKKYTVYKTCKKRLTSCGIRA